MAQTDVLQNFDVRFSRGEINKYYQTLINCKGVKPPFMNNGFRQTFTQSTMEKGDGDDFFISKREGFKKVPLYNDSLIEETSSEWLNGTCYDVCIVRGHRYFLYYNDKENKLRIYKQVKCVKGISENETYAKITDGYIVNIVNYNGKDYFPADKSLSKEFLLTTYVRGKQCGQGTKGVGKTTMIAEDYKNFFYDSEKELGGTPGDYLRTNTGLVHVLGLKTSNIDNTINGFQLATSRGKVIELDGVNNSKKDIEYKVFKEYGLTFHFATSDGLVHWHHDEGTASSFEYSFCGAVHFNTDDNGKTPRFYVNSMSVYNQGTIFLNNLGGLFISGVGLDKFFYSGLNIIQTKGVYTTIKEYMSNIILMGPNKMGYLVFDFNKNVGDIFELIYDGGLYSKYSFGIQDNKFLYVRDTKDFYSLKLSYGYGASKPAIELGFLSKFINTDIEGLEEGINEVYISISGNNNYTFITDGGGNTKVLFYDAYYASRFKWMVTGIKLVGYKHGTFYGGGIYSNEGNTDNGNSITQVITAIFGNLTKSVGKKFEYVKSMLGYNSYCTKDNTIFIAHLYDRGFQYDIKYMLNQKGGYIDNIMRLKYDDVNMIDFEHTIESKPIGINITSGKGVMTGFQSDTLTSEFDEYNNLGQFETNILPGRSVGKVGVMGFPIGQPANILIMELIARGVDKLEFGGFFLGFTYLDNDYTRIEDMAHQTI